MESNEDETKNFTWKNLKNVYDKKSQIGIKEELNDDILKNFFYFVHENNSTWEKVRLDFRTYIENISDNFYSINVKTNTVKKWYEDLKILYFPNAADPGSLEARISSLFRDKYSPLPSDLSELQKQIILIERKKQSNEDSYFKKCKISTDTWRLLLDFFAALMGAVVVAIQITYSNNPYVGRTITSIALISAFISRWYQYHNGRFPIFSKSIGSPVQWWLYIIPIIWFSHIFELRDEFKISFKYTIIAYIITIVVDNVVFSFPNSNNLTAFAVSITTFLIAYEGNFSKIFHKSPIKQSNDNETLRRNKLKKNKMDLSEKENNPNNWKIAAVVSNSKKSTKTPEKVIKASNENIPFGENNC